ncbi:MAG TPA: helix-turn-helix domain-containing protein [Puia sp.]|nr:helix-turn-helix domain-containing protein [Puia sp.]
MMVRCGKRPVIRNFERMSVYVYTPENELRDSIDHIWYYAMDELNCRSISIPFLHPELVFNLGDSFQVQAEGGSFDYTASGALSGIYATPVTTSVRGRHRAMGVIFRPEGLYRLFGLPTWRFGMPVGMAEIMGVDEMQGLEAALLEEGTPEEKVRCLEKFLLRVARPEKMPSVVEDFLEAVRTEPLRKGRIKAYLRDAGHAPKQFIQAFKNAVGHTPQTYLQLVQVNKSVELIAGCPGLSLTEVAYEQGFYDQAHFIRVFGKLSGITPSRYRRWVLAGQAHAAFPNTIFFEGNPVQFL